MERLISSESVFSGRVVSLRIDTVEKVAGVRATREIIVHRDCIAAIPLDDNGRVLMVKQFRRPAMKELIEIPAGGVEDGEALEGCVARELQEEIGYLPRRIRRLCAFYAAPGYCTEYIHIFLATELIESRLTAEDTDEIQIERIPVADIPRLIEDGIICDAKSIAGLLAYLQSIGRT